MAHTITGRALGGYAVVTAFPRIGHCMSPGLGRPPLVAVTTATVAGVLGAVICRADRMVPAPEPAHDPTHGR
jgi:hypothetical protein